MGSLLESGQSQLAAMQQNYGSICLSPAGQQNAAIHDFGNQVIYKERGIMKSFRDYLDKHRDLIFTVALVFIADHYLLGGALKERIKKLLHSLLDKAEAGMHKEIAQ